jgi:hypothetical protein
VTAIINTLAVSGSNLYAGGSFTTAGGIPANHIAKWNGSSWSALGSGLDNWMYALAVSGNDLYAGGEGFTINGVPHNVAKWNGSTWSGVGSQFEFDGNRVVIQALAALGNDLYAGGQFSAAGGTPAYNIAKWNGSSWSALGPGMHSYYVLALAVSGSNLYVGGQLTIAGSAVALARWDGSTWSTVGRTSLWSMTIPWPCRAAISTWGRAGPDGMGPIGTPSVQK